MIRQQHLDELASRLREAVEASPARDLQRNLRALLASGFAQLDLVTREEYDVQVELLARLREQLAALEARVAELERRGGG
jgi:BMFP domain-containing protein YqiC